jgi:hypothetical protein
MEIDIKTGIPLHSASTQLTQGNLKMQGMDVVMNMESNITMQCIQDVKLR